jgi:hypothetical protein
MMHGVEDAKLGLSRGIQDLQHVGHAVVGFGNRFDAGPDLAALGDEVVVRIDHQKGGDVLVVSFCRHGISPSKPPGPSALVGRWSIAFRKHGLQVSGS